MVEARAMLSDYDKESSHKGDNNTEHLKPRSAMMLKDHSDYKDKYRRKSHYDRHIDRVGIAQRKIEKIHKQKQAHSTSEKNTEVVMALNLLSLYKYRRYPHQHTSSAQAENGDVNRAHPFRYENLYNGNIHAKKYGREQDEQISFNQSPYRAIGLRHKSKLL